MVVYGIGFLRASIGGGISEVAYSASLRISGLGLGGIAPDQARFLVGIVIGLKRAHRVPLDSLEPSFTSEWIF